MRTLIIYCSEYKHNTEKLAQVYAREIDCVVRNIRDIADVNPEEYDLIGFGSGVYQERLSPKLTNLVHQLDLKGKNTFVFSTSGIGMKFYNHSLIRILLKKGAIVKGSFACKGSFIARDFTNHRIFNLLEVLTKGHPNARDDNKAKRFIAKMIE